MAIKKLQHFIVLSRDNRIPLFDFPVLMAAYNLTAPYSPKGDQPTAIKQLVRGVQGGERYQTLLGATGTGKTFTMANVIAQTGGRRLCWPTTRPWRLSSAMSCASFSPRTPLSTSSLITTTTNQTRSGHDTYIAKTASNKRLHAMATRCCSNGAT